MAEKLQRPGRELANRPLHFFWIVDCSGSMYGEKIGTVNHAIQSTIPDMADAAENNPNAQLLIRTLRFSTGASWVTADPVPVEDFAWEDLDAGGVTDLGKAFDLLAAQLTIPPMPERALPPVLVLLSDGQPTDNYKKSLDRLLQLPWGGKKAVRIAISIGRDADDSVLTEFTGNRELVLQANNAAMLTKMIKWASTAPELVSAPALAGPAPASAVHADSGAASPVYAGSVASGGQKSKAPSAEPNFAKTGAAPAAGRPLKDNGAAGLVLDINQIPNPDEGNVGDVW